MSSHPGMTLRVAARQPLTEAQIAAVIEAALGGVLVAKSQGYWQVHGGLGWIDQVIIGRHHWGEGEGWQIDCTRSPKSYEHGRTHGHYLGEPWMLQAALALRNLSDAAAVSITSGQDCEPDSFDALAALNLYDFEGALVLDDIAGAAAQSLAQARGGWFPMQVGAGSTWVVAQGWLTDEPWGPWPPQGPPLPWRWTLSEESLEDYDVDTLRVDGFGPEDESDVSDDESLAHFTRAVTTLGGRLAACPRVGTSYERVAIPEPGLRLVLCAQRQRLCDVPAFLSASALLRADTLTVARLQRDILSAVYWQAPEGEVTLIWSRFERGPRHLVLRFSRLSNPSGDPWHGEPWQVAWVEAFAAAFNGLVVMAAGHIEGWLPNFTMDEDPNQFALALRRDAVGTWHCRCNAGWFGREQGGMWQICP